MKKVWLALLLSLVLILSVGVASAARSVSASIGDFDITISEMECAAVGHWEITPTLLSVSMTDGSNPAVKRVSFTVSVYCQICDTTETYTRTNESCISGINCNEGFSGSANVRISNAANWGLRVDGPAHEHRWTGWMDTWNGCMRLCQNGYCQAQEVIPHTLNAKRPCDEVQTCSVCGAEVPKGHDYVYNFNTFPCEAWPSGMVDYHCQRVDMGYCSDHGEIGCDSYTVDNYVPPTCYTYGILTYTAVFTHEGKQHTITNTVHDGDTPRPPHSYGSNGDGTHSCTNEGCTRVEAVNIPCTPGAAATCTTPQTCTECGGVLDDKGGHTEVADPAVPASCASTGLTEGSHCEECGETLREQQVIGLRVHWFGEWSPNGQGGHRASCWSCGASGTQPCTVVELEEKPVCIVCGEYAGIELPVVEATATGKVATAGLLTVHHGEGVLTLAWVSGGNVMRPLGEVTVRVAMDDPGAVRLIGVDGAEVPFTWADGWLTFTTDVASAWRLAE